ncbi:competence protein CoiA [Metabacillus herbersteinensis]|uniref:Competence protein CoiA n=1 Tax=Metabacillus herbersteinensis TaxID=283816 RepID=A0ABV6GE61_9BACI
MLIALNERKEYVNVAEKKWSKDELKVIRKETVFECPVCKRGVELKIGSIKIPHFSHKKNDLCFIKGEPESEYHLSGKLQLFQWIQKQQVDSVYLEYYLPAIQQRPDIYFEQAEKKVAIEYQCSTIDQKSLLQRSRKLQQLSITVQWVLGAKKVQRTGTNTYRMTPFVWLFTMISKTSQPPKLIVYCPVQKSFIILHHIIPFTSQNVLAISEIVHIDSTNYHSLFRKEVSMQALYANWFKKVSRFRLLPPPFESSEVRYFNSLLYTKKQLPIAYIPTLALLPIKTAYLIQSNSYIWQTYILLYIDSKRASFSFRDITREITRKINERRVKIRYLPHIKNMHFSYTLKEYLSCLCSLGLIRKGKDGEFIKVKDVVWTNDPHQLVESDEWTKQKLLHLSKF